MGKAKGRILIDKATFKILNLDAQKLLTQAEEMHLKGIVTIEHFALYCCIYCTCGLVYIINGMPKVQFSFLICFSY